MPALDAIIGVEDVSGAIRKIENDWTRRETREAAIELIRKMFPNRRALDYSSFFRTPNDTLLCLIGYGTSSFEIDSYDEDLDSLTRGVSSMFRELSSSGIRYSVNEIGIRQVVPRKRDLARKGFSDTLFLSLITFILGILFTSPAFRYPESIELAVISVAAIGVAYEALYVYTNYRGFRNVNRE